MKELTSKRAKLEDLVKHPGWELFVESVNREIIAQRNKADEALLGADPHVSVGIGGILKGLKMLPDLVQGAIQRATLQENMAELKAKDEAEKALQVDDPY